MGFCREPLFEEISIVTKALSFYRLGDGNGGPEGSRTCLRLPNDSAAILRQESMFPGCHSCFLSFPHSFLAKASQYVDAPRKRPCSLWWALFPTDPLKSFFSPIGPHCHYCQGMKGGALIASSTQAPRPTGHRAGPPLPTVTLWNALSQR